MPNDDNPIAGDLHIHFERGHTHSKGIGKRGKGILRAGVTPAAMGLDIKLR